MPLYERHNFWSFNPVLLISHLLLERFNNSTWDPVRQKNITTRLPRRRRCAFCSCSSEECPRPHPETLKLVPFNFFFFCPALSGAPLTSETPPDCGKPTERCPSDNPTSLRHTPCYYLLSAASLCSFCQPWDAESSLFERMVCLLSTWYFFFCIVRSTSILLSASYFYFVEYLVLLFSWVPGTFSFV